MTIFSAFAGFSKWKTEVVGHYGSLANFPDRTTISRWIQWLEEGVTDEAQMRSQLPDPQDPWIIDSTPVLANVHLAIKELQAWKK